MILIILFADSRFAGMTQSTISALVDRWLNDPQFRQALRSDPKGTVESSGYTLVPDEWAALQAIDWSLSDEQLQTRASKIGG